MADVLAVLPFGNTAVTVYITGETILEMLERSVYRLTGNPELDIVEDLDGSFLQFSGLQVIFSRYPLQTQFGFHSNPLNKTAIFYLSGDLQSQPARQLQSGFCSSSLCQLQCANV